jgi:hypothetical protein
MFMVCDSVGNTTLQPNVNVPQLTAPQAVLRPQFIPGNFSFGIAVGVIGVDLNKNNEIQFTIKAPDGKTVQDSGKNIFPALNEEDVLPEEYRGLMLTLDIRNLVIEIDGIYTFSLWINDELIGERNIPIYAVKRK